MIKIRQNLNKLVTYSIEDLGIENISPKDKIYIIVLSILGNKKVSEKEAEEVCRSIIKKERESEINPQLVEKDVHKINVILENSNQNEEEKEEITEIEIEDNKNEKQFEETEELFIDEDIELDNDRNIDEDIEEYSEEEYQDDLEKLGIEDEDIQLEKDEKIENEMYAELEEKDNLLKEKEERYLRMYAEFENYKKRTEKEKQNTKLYAKADVLEMLLPVIDSMENAISIETEDENLKQGIGLMFEQIKIFLKKNEVEEIGKVRRNV